MAAFRTEETALGSARGRFLESLPRKAIELRGSLAQLIAEPAASGPRDEARRRLHALFASALVFRSEALAALVQEGIARLDSAAEAARALGTGELELLSTLVKRIAEFRIDEHAPAAPTISDVAPAPTGRRRSNTLTGLLPVGAPIATPSEMPGRWVARTTGRPAEARRPTLQRVLHVLVAGPEAELAELCQLLRDDSLRVSAVGSASEALESAADGAPDVILAAAALLADGLLIEGLRKSPLTDFVPLVAIVGSAAEPAIEGARAPGIDEVVTHPLRIDLLLRVLGRATGTLVEAEALPSLREANIEEVAARVGEEIRRGLVDAAESGRDVRVSLGEGAEVLAAAWAAVARVRALFSERSGGRVRFSDRNLHATPALLTLGAEAAALPAPSGESPLAGRRIVVADDDTAVVLFFARLLREEGAYVTEASDGAEALRAARRERPDLVIGDVIMPGLDGFALCRELKRDPLLADVPVILISWKEDLLARMRELSSGASGYLRKEASAAQIVAGVREVLAARSRLEADLSGSSEVRGNLEGTGVVALMRSVRRARPDARVTLRDAWNLFECELRDGRLAQLTRTASDGSFVRNEKALPQLLGVTAGRFAVTAAEGALKQALEGTLDEVLARGARELGAQLDALSGEQLERVERVVFDEDAQAGLLEHVPPLVREVVRCLSEGERPSDLWRRGVVERALLQPMLLDMAKRGAIRAVLGAQREDLVAQARAQRSRLPPTELGSPRSMLPPAPVPVISVLPGDRSELPPKRDPFGEESPTSEVVVTSSILPPAPAAGGELAAREAPAAEPLAAPRASDARGSELGAEAAAGERAVEAGQSAREHEPEALASAAAVDLQPAGSASERAVEARAAAGAEHVEVGASAGEQDVAAGASVRGLFESEAHESARDQVLLARGTARFDAAAAHEQDPAAPEPEVTALARAAVADAPAQAAGAAQQSAPAPAEARPLGSSPSDARELDRGAAEARSSRGTLWAWTAAFVALVAIGFLLDRARTPELVAPRVEAIGGAPERAKPKSPQLAPEPASVQAAAARAASAEPSEAPLTSALEQAPPAPAAPPLVSGAEGGFEISERILDPSVNVAPDQALLVVEAKPGADESQLSLDGKVLGALPLKLGVSEGIHELAIMRGDSVVYRFLAPRRGSTWLLREP
jgi:CheY-like chemotaxis protein